MSAANDSNLAAPLVPADCDLRDFQFMPVDVHRLLTSETWILGTGDERAAAMTLWLASWHQVPAGSIPKDDRMLAHLSQSGSKWKKLKAHTLRGWIEASDGRLYHPVVAEKALEAWVEKLAYSLSGSAGNAKRWGVSIETDSTRDRALAAISMLRALAPQSKALKKKAVAVIESGSRTDSGGDDKSSGGDDDNESGGDPARIARDSKGTVKGSINTPKPPDGGLPAPKGRSPRIALQTFLDECKAKNERPIRDYAPVWKHAEEAGLPHDFVALAWIEFSRRFGRGGIKEAGRQRNWRQAFRNYVEGNYLKLWAIDANGTYFLTTQGKQAQKIYEAREAA